MKLINKKFYISYLIFIFLFIILANGIIKEISMKYYFSQAIIITMISKCIIFFILGLILAIDYFYNEIIKSGTWKINFSKLFLFDIPFLVLILVRFIWFLGFFTIPNYFLTIPDEFYFVLSTILGYMLASSFYKISEI